MKQDISPFFELGKIYVIFTNRYIVKGVLKICEGDTYVLSNCQITVDEGSEIKTLAGLIKIEENKIEIMQKSEA